MPSQEQGRQRSEEQLNVSLLYGAYVPKESPLVSLTGQQRAHLFVLQTFTTPGIYVKSMFLALMNQASGTPYEWGGGFEGFGRRAASSYARSSMQNVFSTVGNAALRYEPRYDRCRCVGFGPRTKHALMRNFVTYNKTGKALRPQFALYGAAFGAGMLSGLWQPKRQLSTDGYRGVETQVGLGHAVKLGRGVRAGNRTEIEKTEATSPRQPSVIVIARNTTAPEIEGAWSEDDMLRKIVHTTALLLVIAANTELGHSQSPPDLQTYFQQYVGLSQDQIASVRKGQPVTKALPSRAPSEVFLFGTVYIHAAPEKYLQFARDYNRLRKLPNNLALGMFSNPPRPVDLKGFAFDNSEISDLKNCKPGDCQIQVPASGMEELHKSINWSAADPNDQMNQLLQKAILQGLIGYQHEGNVALGDYNDKPDPAEVPKQFAYMLSYGKALPVYLPDFYRYLLDYPKSKPANVEDTFYWANVKFGLKPTLRVVHVVTMRGGPADQVAYAIAEKRLYASHYFGLVRGIRG